MSRIVVIIGNLTEQCARMLMMMVATFGPYTIACYLRKYIRFFSMYPQQIDIIIICKQQVYFYPIYIASLYI